MSQTQVCSRVANAVNPELSLVHSSVNSLNRVRRGFVPENFLSAGSGSFSNMSSMTDTLAGLHTAVDAAATVDFDALGLSELLESLENLEKACRRAVAVCHTGAAALARRDRESLKSAPHALLADVLRISPAAARRRMRDAAQLVDRTSLSGQPLPPELPATAAAWKAGTLDVEHLRTIQTFIDELPDHLPVDEVERAEAFLADKAGAMRPDQLKKVADRLAITLNPDGAFSDADRARQRGFTWSPQRRDGMSIGRLVATPQLRAEIDAWLAKFAAPGMCNPADQNPVVTGSPSQEVMDRDARGTAQRQHDALSVLVRGQLGDPKLGRHKGLPVTVIVSASLEQLQTGAGQAVTAGGTLLPISDLIRMASHAWHYLCVYDSHDRRPLYLGRTKRIATGDQRAVLHALHRGCTAPGCTMPGYLCEAHHVTDWAAGGLTNIDELTFACRSHNLWVTEGGWATRKRSDGSTEWIPPPDFPLRGGVNDYHHPERLMPRPEDGAA